MGKKDEPKISDLIPSKMVVIPCEELLVIAHASTVLIDHCTSLRNTYGDLVKGLRNEMENSEALLDEEEFKKYRKDHVDDIIDEAKDAIVATRYVNQLEDSILLMVVHMRFSHSECTCKGTPKHPPLEHLMHGLDHVMQMMKEKYTK